MACLQPDEDLIKSKILAILIIAPHQELSQQKPKNSTSEEAAMIEDNPFLSKAQPQVNPMETTPTVPPPAPPAPNSTITTTEVLAKVQNLYKAIKPLETEALNLQREKAQLTMKIKKIQFMKQYNIPLKCLPQAPATLLTTHPTIKVETDNELTTIWNNYKNESTESVL